MGFRSAGEWHKLRVARRWLTLKLPPHDLESRDERWGLALDKAARWVGYRCGIGFDEKISPGMLGVLAGALKMRREFTGEGFETVARLMVERWFELKECKEFMPRGCWSTRQFFRDGYWLNAELWPVDWERLSKSRKIVHYTRK